MKKILSLLLVSSPIFSMQLGLVNSPTKVKISYKKLFEHTGILNQTLIEPSSNFISHELESSKVRIDPTSVFVPHLLGSVKLYHDGNGFFVIQNDKKHEIKKYNTDSMIRNITRDELQSFFKVGYFSLNQMSDGEFSLKATGRLNGDGPLFGGFMYWLTKSLCYGGLAAAAGTTVVTTGGAIVGAVAGGAVAGGAGTVTALAIAGNTASGVFITTASTTTLGAAITTTAGVGLATASTAGAVLTGTGMVATAATATTAGAVITKAAVVGAGAAIASGASAGGIIAGIEALSTTIGSFFGMLPTP